MAIAAVGSISWPLLLARWSIGVAYHGMHLGARAVSAAGPVVALSSALLALLAWRRKHVTVDSLVAAGSVGGVCVGALLLVLCEMWRIGGELGPVDRVALASRSLAGGIMWSAPVSIVVGGSCGFAIWWLARVAGLVGPVSPISHLRARRAVVVAAVAVELCIAGVVLAGDRV
jgi:hypothetical protein